jgi:hypothetical protein
VWLGDPNSDDFHLDYDPRGDKTVLLTGTYVWGFKLSTRIDVGQDVTYTAPFCFSLKDRKITMWIFGRETIEGRVDMIVDDVSSFERGFELVFNHLLRYLNQRPDSQDGAATDMGFDLSPRTVP